MSQSPLYVIRPALPADAEALRRLAELDSQWPLAGDALLGERDGEIVVAMSMRDGRVVADPFRHTADVQVLLHARASARDTVERWPSLRERLRPAVAVPGAA